MRWSRKLVVAVGLALMVLAVTSVITFWLVGAFDTPPSQPAIINQSIGPSGAPPPEGNSRIDHYLMFALFVMSVVTGLSVFISFYLYRWRRILLSNPQMLVPEELGKWMAALANQANGVVHAVSSLAGEHQTMAHHLARNQDQVGRQVKDFSETLSALQSALDEKDADIRRLKRGYDAEIFRKFVSRFIRVDQAIGDLLNSNPHTASELEQLRRLLHDAFAECGVEVFSPSIGDDYRKADGVADNPKTSPTDDPSNEYKISEILEVGYRIRSRDHFDILVPAKVRILSAA